MRLAAYYNYLKITNAAVKRVEEKAEEIKFDFKLKGFDESSHLVAAQPAAAATLNWAIGSNLAQPLPITCTKELPGLLAHCPERERGEIGNRKKEERERERREGKTDGACFQR